MIEAAVGFEGFFSADANRKIQSERWRRWTKVASPRRERWQPPVGSVVLLSDDLMAFLDRPDPALEVVDLGVLLLIASQIANAKALSPGARIEGHGDSAALVLDHTFGLGVKYDPDGRVGNFQQIIGHLCGNGWLATERVGHETHLRLGSRLLKAAKKGAN